VHSRRTFLRTAVGGAIGWPLTRGAAAASSAAGETLYNGIVLGTPWPPPLKYPAEHPVTPSYLVAPPGIIPIDVGRQLFIDDFLIDDTNLRRVWHQPVYHDRSPVLRPEKPWEITNPSAERTGTEPNPSAMVFSDGVFFDPADRLFKMWYMGGYGATTCLATSEDGISWTRPAFDVVPGTNVVNRTTRDSSTVWLDHVEPDRRSRFKKALFYNDALNLFTSPDGVHWNAIGTTGFTYDRSTFFYNPFRRVWVFSLRDNQILKTNSGRYRRYWESAVFAANEKWDGRAPVAWVKADSRDWVRPGFNVKPELYNVDCVAYESLLLGLFSIWRGEPLEREKINEVSVGFSRDGFHWHRPDRTSFLPVSDTPGSWNWANVQSAGGCCVVIGDQLYFYASGRAGRPGSNAPGVCSTGLAVLRRDGFASMEWSPNTDRPVRVIAGVATGMLTTRPVRFSGEHLFVNVELRNGGELRAEILDRGGSVIAPFDRSACAPVTASGTRQRVAWPAATLKKLAGEAVRIRFTLTDGNLYAFWVSASARGHSNGYPAAGGPEFSGPIDR
jgi:hypothetical protein